MGVCRIGRNKNKTLTFNVCSARFFGRSCQPQQADRISFCFPPLGAFGWLMVESRDSRGFIPLFRKAKYGLDSLLS